MESGEKEGKLVTNHSPLATKYIRVEITDTGEGIKPEDLSKLFNPMHSTKSMHIGLSLAIAHRLVEAHGGYMDVKSKAGEGTSFFINLPLAYNPSKKETTQAKEAQREGQKTYMGMDVGRDPAAAQNESSKTGEEEVKKLLDKVKKERGN